MSDDSLKNQLRGLRTPSASATVRERARHRALIAFQQGAKEKTGVAPKNWLAWNWRYAVALALMMSSAASFFVLRPNRAPENLANDRQILQQTEELFPRQVNAVVERNGKIDLSIAQSPVLGGAQPVVLVFRRGGDLVRVLSYSGHRVCLKLGEKEQCFDILATPAGGVILEGDDQVWLPGHSRVDGYSLHAQNLMATL